MDNQQISTKYRNKINAFELTALIVLALIYVLLLVFTTIYFDKTNATQVSNSIVSLISLIFVILLFGFCLGGFTWNEKEKMFFEWIIIIFYFIFILQELNALLPYTAKTLKIHFILDNSFYVSASIYWVCIWTFLKGKFESRFNEKYLKLLVISFFAVFSLLAILNMFTEFDFSYSENGIEIKHYFLSTLSVIWYIVYAVIILHGKSDIKTKLTLLSYSVFPLISYVLLLVFKGSSFYLMLSINIDMVLYLIPLYLIFFNVYMERGKILLMNEKELEKSRANVMALQINPHFIANTMSSIVALCEDAPEARDLAEKFASYLRDNYVNMSSEQLISFKTELQHVKNYLEVEKVRFPNLKDEYDISCDNFLLPTLTVQTLVENAVRHGIQKKKNASGRVLIKSYEENKRFIVEIIDDGVGITEEKPADGKAHVGIENVKSRLNLLCDGRLEIKSKQGEGTTCKIIIPKKKKV